MTKINIDRAVTKAKIYAILVELFTALLFTGAYFAIFGLPTIALMCILYSYSNITLAAFAVCHLYITAFVFCIFQILATYKSVKEKFSIIKSIANIPYQTINLSEQEKQESKISKPAN